MSSKLTSSLLLYSIRSEKRISQLSLTSSLALYLARSEKRICQVWLPKNLYSIQHAQKTHMSSKIDFKSRTLFGTLRKRIVRLWLLVLYAALTENAHVKKDCLKYHTLFGMLRKCTCHLWPRLIWHAQRKHMLSKIAWSLALYSARRENALVK